MKTLLKILTAEHFLKDTRSENEHSAVRKQELTGNIDKAFGLYINTHRSHIDNMTQSIITCFFCHLKALAQAQYGDTVSDCDLEVFLSEVGQVGAISNTRGDARDLDRDHDSGSDPDDPLSWVGY